MVAAAGKAIFPKVCTGFKLTYYVTSLPREVPWAARLDPDSTLDTLVSPRIRSAPEAGGRGISPLYFRDTYFPFLRCRNTL